jgi:hypothetical protein
MSESEPASYAEEASAAGAGAPMIRYGAAAAEDQGAEVSAAGERSRPTCDSERIDEASQEAVLGFLPSEIERAHARSTTTLESSVVFAGSLEAAAWWPRCPRRKSS